MQVSAGQQNGRCASVFAAQELCCSSFVVSPQPLSKMPQLRGRLSLSESLEDTKSELQLAQEIC